MIKQINLIQKNIDYGKISTTIINTRLFPSSLYRKISLYFYIKATNEDSENTTRDKK